MFVLTVKVLLRKVSHRPGSSLCVYNRDSQLVDHIAPSKLNVIVECFVESSNTQEGLGSGLLGVKLALKVHAIP